jgi:hypothetical protein
VQKAYITLKDPYDPTPVPVFFNPEEYTQTKDINYAHAGVPGLNSPILQFVHGNTQTLEMELFLDTYEAHNDGNTLLNRGREDVRIFTRRITDLMIVNPETHAPPVVLFMWPPSLSFECVVTRVSQRFIMFLPDGTPVRARLQVAFSEYQNPELAAQRQKNQTADYSKVHVAGEGETLASVAAVVYRDPALWRPIALVNGIDHPRRLTPGQKLLIPRLPYRNPETGEVMQ